MLSIRRVSVVELTGERSIPASRERVWQALNDPEILRQCITGCEEIDKVSDEEMNAQVVARFGPVKAKFKAKIMIENADPPNGYRLTGEGQGGVAGFAKGGADVSLEDDGDGTLLKYQADMQVGGKLAQIGSRLVSGTTNKIVEDFFEKFSEIV